MERGRDNKGRKKENEGVYIGRGGGYLSNIRKLNLEPKYFHKQSLAWEQAIGSMAVRGNRLVNKQALGYKNSKGEENFQENRGLENGVKNNESIASYL